MKKLFFLAVAALPCSGWAQNVPFTVTGQMEHAGPNAKVYINYTLAGNSLMDSAMVINGKFQLKGSISGPTQSMMVLDHNGVGLTTLLKQKYDVKEVYLDEENISVKVTDSLKNATIAHSKINDDKAAYAAALAKQDQEIGAIQQEYNTASPDKHKDSLFEKGITSRYQKAVDGKLVVMSSYADKNPDSYFSLVALSAIAATDMDVSKVEPLYNKLSAHIKSSALGKYFATSIAAAKATAIGSPAPVFTQNDVNGKPVNLADFRGKYVLIDFWASWCGPCRAENPNVVKAYYQYKDKKFTILGVSLDQPAKKAEWLAAVKADGLEWTQVSEMNAPVNPVATLYGVSAIPQNYLIDPQGKIIGKNLRGEDLNKKLASLFN